MCEPAKIVSLITLNRLRQRPHLYTPVRSWCVLSGFDTSLYKVSFSPQRGHTGPDGHRIRSTYPRAESSFRNFAARRTISFIVPEEVGPESAQPIFLYLCFQTVARIH